MNRNQKLSEAVRSQAKEEEGRLSLSCAEAFKLAAEQNVPVGQIGRICNEQNIKIRCCQLGCFK